MDGFDSGLKSSLRKSFGDYILYSREGFFDIDESTSTVFDENELSYTKYLKTEGFFLFDNFSKGMVIHGVEPSAYQDVTGLKFNIGPGEIAIGSELAEASGVKVGDQIVITLAQGKGQFKNLPKLFPLKVSSVLEHGIYDKDLRFGYVMLPELQDMMGIKNKINLIALKANNAPSELQKQDVFFNNLLDKVDQNLDPLFVLKPFWAEYETLIEAVEVEKVSITVILQVIVFVAIFNVLAFVMFLNERKSKEIFLFQTLGLGPKKMMVGWVLLILMIWFLSCVLAIIFKHIFAFALNNFEAFSLPGDIYTLSNIELFVPTASYLIVFSLALLWLILCSIGLFFSLKGKSLLSRLRMEYS